MKVAGRVVPLHFDLEIAFGKPNSTQRCDSLITRVLMLVTLFVMTLTAFSSSHTARPLTSLTVYLSSFK